MPASGLPDGVLAALNDRQREAACHGDGPLLIVAGAGTGKTTTLAHRVAHLIAAGTPAGRILLLTFARRAAAEMLHRVDAILRHVQAAEAADSLALARASESAQVWGGTFHAVANRLLRMHGEAVGLRPDFTVHDRPDSEDLLDVVRAELGLARAELRFPRKATCMDVYSRCVNARARLEPTIAQAFPWLEPHAADLKRLFGAYVDRKQELQVLDYDDLLLYLHGLLGDAAAGAAVRRRFDRVLVDEYQDTNALQAEILARLRPDGRGLTVVGDDAQSIYSFRAATVRNILEFPAQFAGTKVVTLDQSFRATMPLLEATNRVIAQAAERHDKRLWSRRASGASPELVTCQDEEEQAELVIQKVLEHREQGIDLRRQAVLFRASHHSLQLEIELQRRGIPFHKYGGLRFVESAHVKDLLAFLRLAENPRDLVAGTRALGLLPGIGPRKARQMLEPVIATGGFEPWRATRPPAASADLWPRFVTLMEGLAGPARNDGGSSVASQVHRVRAFYAPLLERRYDHAAARLRDLEQLEQAAAGYGDRRAFVTELALDPPSSTQDLAGPPSLDDDWLNLSTIHSAKGLEWDAVYVLHAADGNIPSDLTTGKPAEIEEELRLFYVALSRAKDFLYVCFPLRYYSRPAGMGGAHTYAQLTRFLPESVRTAFHERPAGLRKAASDAAEAGAAPAVPLRKQIRDMWG